ncbi:Uncharacterised protein [Legionella steigerwaltii]|uniref:Transmembrane protein n=1 Tax=Legionella steigerwaltii TaxID=460 RepID=A0A378LDI1_9GAMM|nr:DUF6632 domain-containing protein [Legionella steigerwaltii]KTD77791.1 hypothetical protein Lstg_1514 [Legionella steigerwaltii]STY24430.1 Uncharacterised protein [Legionella steigerwaltii]
MDTINNYKLLRVVLIIVGLIFIFAIYPLTVLWPSGWAWHLVGQNLYLQMILGIYVTLGVFLLLAAKNPIQHLSLIWFTVWSSIVHGGIMCIQALYYPQHFAHLYGDVPALFIIAIVLAVLTPRRSTITE